MLYITQTHGNFKMKKMHTIEKEKNKKRNFKKRNKLYFLVKITIKYSLVTFPKKTDFFSEKKTEKISTKKNFPVLIHFR